MDDRLGKLSGFSYTLDDGSSLCADMPVVIQQDSDGTDIVRPLLSNSQVLDLAGVVRNLIKPENMTNETREVLSQKNEALIRDNAKLRKECDNLRRWNKHLEQKLLGFVELAFRKLGADGLPNPRAEESNGSR